jgi:hypothetical protein
MRGTRRHRRRALPRAPDRLLSSAERLAVRTSKNWVAGYPKLVAQWHPTRNVDIFPYEVSYGSEKPIWWKCQNGPDHEWSASAYSRIGRGQGCPYCAGRRVSVTNSIATVAPQLAAEWHPSKNGKLRPSDLTTGSARWVWWRCARRRQHEWQSSPHARSGGRKGCPYCAGLRLSVTNSLARLFPDVAATWHAVRNGHLTPADVTAHTKTVSAWWQCPVAKDHVWRTAVGRRVRTGCPFCSGKRIATSTSIAGVAPKVAREFDSVKNAPLTPASVHHRSRRLVWWRCSKLPRHVWRATVENRTRGGTGCPFCAKSRLSPENSLLARAPKVARMWDPESNSSLKPSQISADSKRVCAWRCTKDPSHRFRRQVRLAVKIGVCPFCAGRRAAPGVTLATTAPLLSSEWHGELNGGVSPADVTPRSSRIVWWKCPRGADHVWAAPVSRRARGAGCPFCAGKRASATNSLRANFPKAARLWHPTKNGSLRVEEVVAGSALPAWWRCESNARHVWRAPIRLVAKQGCGCPHCGHDVGPRGRGRR